MGTSKLQEHTRQWGIIRTLSLIEVEIPIWKRVYRLETLVFKPWGCAARFPPGTVGAEEFQNRTKQLSSDPVSFRLSILPVNDEFLTENSQQNPIYKLF